MRLSAKEIARTALLLAAALILHRIEAMFPPPVPQLPGVRLGLANIAVLYLLYAGSAKGALTVALLRALLGPLLGGSVTGIWYALCGGLLSFAGMYGAKRSKVFSVYGISVLGACLHHAGQLAAASVVLNASVFAFLPYMNLLAIPTGLATAALCALALRRIPGEKASM